MKKLLILEAVFLFASYIHNATGQWQRPPRWTKDQSCTVRWRTRIEDEDKFDIQVEVSYSNQKGMIRLDLPEQDINVIWSLYDQRLTYTFPWGPYRDYAKTTVEKPFKMKTTERGIALSIMYPDLSNFTFVGGSHPYYTWKYEGLSENGNQVMSEVLLKQDEGQNPEIVQVISQERFINTYANRKRSTTYYIRYQYGEPPEAIWTDTNSNALLLNETGTQGGELMVEKLVKTFLMGVDSIWSFDIHPWLGMYQIINDRPSLRSGLAHQKPFPYLREFENYPYPRELDWNRCGAVSAVKNQYQCAACATFVAVSVLESAHYIHTREKLNLAVQAALDCSWGEGNHGCFEGYPPNVFEWVITNGGIPTTEMYGYGQFRRMNGRCVMFDLRSPGAKITSWTKIPSKIGALKMALLRHGPVAVGATLDGLFNYNTNVDFGIIQTPANMSAPLEHGLLVVGWGESPYGTPYWVVRNSWGSEWGLQGYARVLMSEERNTLRLLDKMYYVNMEYNGPSPTYCDICERC
uniref:Cathepsin L1 n=2 Tax=Lygus hesperus TaxID=30085 RepID=A0A0K8SAJ4_LYGHE